MPGDAKDTGRMNINGSVTMPMWALFAILGLSAGGGIVPNILRSDDAHAIEQLGDKVEKLATKDDLKSVSSKFDEMSREHVSVLVDLRVLKDRVAGQELRLQQLEQRRTR